MNYFWIRIFDYSKERDGYEKGSLLHEYYLDDVLTREEAKNEVLKRFPNVKMHFAKPKKDPGLYAIIMDSNKFFFDRFYKTIDTICFYCHEPIQGHARDFPRYNDHINESDFDEHTVYFCKNECYQKFRHLQDPIYEGEFQEKEAGQDGKVFGYIYLIYNRRMNMYYIGQTRFLPFFRWQEHVKSQSKGDISDLVFSVLSEARNDSSISTNDNQAYLNSLESWWISKYIDEGYSVMNITRTRITIDELRSSYEMMIAKSSQTQLI